MSDRVKPSCVVCAWRGSCQKKYGIVDPSRCQDFSLDLSIKDLPGRKGVKLLVAGRPGSGKTTLVERVITRLGDGVKIGGFVTREMRKSGERYGFKIITVDKVEAVLAKSDMQGSVKVGRYTVNLEALETVAVPAIKRALAESTLVVIDEIGKMELSSRNFQEMVEIALDSSCAVLATVPSEGVPFVEKLKSRQDVRLLVIDPAGRDEALEEAVAIIEGGLA